MEGWIHYDVLHGLQSAQIGKYISTIQVASLSILLERYFRQFGQLCPSCKLWAWYSRFLPSLSKTKHFYISMKVVQSDMVRAGYRLSKVSPSVVCLIQCDDISCFSCVTSGNNFHLLIMVKRERDREIEYYGESIEVIHLEMHYV